MALLGAAVRRLAFARTRLPREVRELLAVLATTVLHLTFIAGGWPRGWLVIPLVAAWGAYVLVTARREPEALDAWGLRRRGLVPASLATLAFALPAGLTMIAFGIATGAPFPPTMLVALVLYPVWGFVQQLLLQGMVAGPLARRVGVLGASSIATALFAAVHASDPAVMGATLLLGTALVPIFLRWGNLWPLALAHGWLGTLLYYAVLHRDPVAGYLGP